MKTCSKCLIEKSIFDFSKMKDSRDGLQRCCKECNRCYRESNKNLISENKKKCYFKSKDKYQERIKQNYLENICDRLLYAKEYRELNKRAISLTKKNCHIKNPELYSSIKAKRRAAKLKALPKWLTKAEHEEIKELYEIARMFKLYTGEEYHVDHIVPLQGENVCGLHVPWNLQVIPAKDNLSKSNKLQEETL